MENEKHEHNHSNCNNLCCGSLHKYHILRWLLGIFILIITFTIGYKLGEFKEYCQNNVFGKFQKQNYMYGRQGAFNKAHGPAMMNEGTVFFRDDAISGINTQAVPPMMYWQQTTSTTPQK